MHKRRHPPADPGGAIKVSGRYNRGFDQFSEDESFGALYLATRPEICLGEVYRHITPDLLPSLTHDTDYEVTQSIGAAAYGGGFEGLLVPSAARLGDNLILFMDHLGAGSTIVLLSSRDPRLYVERHRG